MPKTSGLFTLIELCIADNSIQSLPMCNRHILKGDATTPYYLLFRHNTGPDINPFTSLGMQLADVGHWRIDKNYSKSLDVRTLSYCHGTEYFSNSIQKMVVHYYFDTWGYLTQINCKLNGASYRIAPDQMKLLIQRATDYSDAITMLLRKKQERFLKFVADIEDLTKKIIKEIKAARSNNEFIKQLLEQRASMLRQRNALCDEEGLELKDDSFDLYLRKLIEDKAQTSTPAITAEATTANETEEDQAAESSEEELSIGENEEELATKATQQHKKHNAPKKSKAVVPKQFSKTKQRLKSLLNISATLQQNTPAQTLSAYLEELGSLRLEVLMLNNASLNQEFDKVKSELALFEAALEQHNLEHIQILLPYSVNQVSIEKYNHAFYTWISEAKRVDNAFLSGLAVYDYLHENCPVFQIFISLQSMRMIEGNTTSYALLYLAYLSRNQQLFSALLRYGLNPHMCWVMQKDKYFMPLQIIVKDCFDSGFYVDELVKYGVTIKKNPREKIIATSDLYKYKHKMSSAQYEKLQAMIRQHPKQPNTAAQSKTYNKFQEVNGDAIITCAFLNFTFSRYFEKSDALFNALARNTDLESLLIGLAHTSNSTNIVYLWVTNAVSSNFITTTRAGLEAQTLAIQGVDLKNAPNHLNIIFLIDGDEDTDTIRTKFLISLIKQKLQNMTPGELDEVEAKINTYIHTLNELNFHGLSRELYTALNFLYIARGSLTEAQQTKLVENFANIAFNVMREVDVIKGLIEQRMRERLAQGSKFSREELIQAQTEMHKQAATAINNLHYATNAAYFTIYLNIRKLPIVTKCFALAERIMRDKSKLSEESREFWHGHYQSQSMMEACLLEQKPWLKPNLSPSRPANRFS